jgi:signal transduction histidine kinase
MDRLSLLATIPLQNLDAIYQVRAKVFQAAMTLTRDTDLSAQIAAQFSDLARSLHQWTYEPRALFFFDSRGRDKLLRIEFCFDEWIAEPENFLVGGLYLNAVHELDRYSLVRNYRVSAALDSPLARDVIVHILTDKTREELFADLNAKNTELQKEIEERKAAEESVLQAQRELVAKEKLAALGGLVAGIAHEINTPVGIGVTAASHLSEAIREFTTLYKSGSMRRSDLETFLGSAQESNVMVEENLQRASRLIRSFKEVAVDQTADDEREFMLRDYAEQVIISLKPKLRQRPVEISLDGIDPSLRLMTTPGPMSQILTNLIVNSLVHGFDPEQAGHITISARNLNGTLELVYADDGKGIAAEHMAKIFEPFFTTKRSHGGSGLGMHLIYNIVTKKYSGTIKCDSTPGHGVTFRMTFPQMFNE